MKRSLCLVPEKLLKIVAPKMSISQSRSKVAWESSRNKKKEQRKALSKATRSELVTHLTEIDAISLTRR